MDFQLIHSAVEEIVLQVGQRVSTELKASNHAQFTRKGPTDLVTEIDLWAEQQVLKFVQERFPDHLVLGEETSGELCSKTGRTLEQLAARGVCWFVDPIDGTTNFTSRIPFVSVSVGVLVDGVRSVGVVYDAARGEVFSAVRGTGARMNGMPIAVSKKSELIDAVLATDFPHELLHQRDGKSVVPSWMGKVRAVRCYGSAALEGCWVACGRLDIYYNSGLKPWDVAAASLIIEEAGGKIFCPEVPGQFSLYEKRFLYCADGLAEKLIG